ncbi:MAG: L-fucose:H+ symporter permease [Cytophagaceae bacterium]|nr:L-fucose:H+ symporter permease [Cytophagaceae bacterium]
MAGISNNSNPVKATIDPNANYTVPLVVVTTLFFIWAFVTNLNDVLVPYLKRACALDDFTVQLVNFAFFIAYFVMSIPASMIIRKMGYQKGIVVGLGLMIIGAALFIPAASTRIYLLFLGGLFILASGVTLLQVAANPYVSLLGRPETASSRLNLSQAFNSIGAAAGPYLGGLLILSQLKEEEYEKFSAAEKLAYLNDKADDVVWGYVGLIMILLFLCMLIGFAKLPKIQQEEEVNSKFNVFQHSNLVFGIISIFMYVGAEVAIGTNLIRFAGLKNIAGLSEQSASLYATFYMICAATGRFLGAYLLGKIDPGKAVGFNAAAAIVLILTAVFGSGYIALICLVFVGLCNSIMFPTIFTLGIKGLGPYMAKGSSYLVMAIVGGAFIPPVMGLMAKMLGGDIQTAFLIPAACYVFIAFYGFKGSKNTKLEVEEILEKSPSTVAG